MKTYYVVKKDLLLTYPHSPVKVVVIPTDEESMIARDVMTFGGLK